MSQINPKQQILAALSHGENLTSEEIANLTDLPIGHCTMILNRLVLVGAVTRNSGDSGSVYSLSLQQTP
jgi:DNA-binding IclR family transcriptional regulator